VVGSNRQVTSPDSSREQGLEVEGSSSGPGHTGGWRVQRQEGIGRGNPMRLCLEGKPLEGKTLYTAVGRNKPTRPVVEQTVEGGRNAEDGT